MRFHLSRRDLRLATGLVLFSYVALHLVNHSLGLVSVAFAERGLGLTLGLWHSVPGTTVLYGAACIHLALAFESLYGRRTLRMAPLDLIRVALGLGIPTLLIGHAVGTRVAWEMYRQSPQYSRVVWSLWATDGQGRQLALLVPGWLHGCFGIHLAFSGRPIYQRLHRLLFAVALLLPVLGGLGFLAMGKELAADLSNRGHLDASLVLPFGAGPALLSLRETLLVAYFSACAVMFFARTARSWSELRSNALVSIQYPQRTVRVPRGWTVLEASRSHHLPHMAMCGGRGRCSTCRVRVTSGLEQCPPVGRAEAATLARIRAQEGVRLACQLRPEGDIRVIPLLSPGHQRTEEGYPFRTVEQDLVIVCVDWRNRAALARSMLPQDAVFLAGHFHDTVSLHAREEGGLECDRSANASAFVFGVGIDLTIACRRALSVAHDVEQALSDLTDRWRNEFGVTADFAICVHVGPAAIGDMGSGLSRGLIAAGPAVEAAQSLRMAAATNRTRIVVSVDVLRQCGAHPAVLEGLDLHEMDGARGLRVVTPTSLQHLSVPLGPLSLF
jgi:adenylate cyclase